MTNFMMTALSKKLVSFECKEVGILPRKILVSRLEAIAFPR
jgi:hypothetical protein